MQAQAGASPFSASLRIGGLYDTRVGSTSSDIISTHNQEDSALAGIFNAGYQLPFKDNFGLRFDYSGYADFHEDFREFDTIDQSISVEPQYSYGGLIYSLPLAYNYVLEDNKSDYYRYSVSPTVTYRLPKLNHAVSVNVLAAKIKDEDDIPDINDDGDTIGVGCAYLIFFEKLSLIRVSVDYEDTEYNGRVADYQSSSLSRSHRDDKILSAGLDAQYNFTPHVGLFSSYTYVHSDSNVDVYEYNRSVIQAGVALRY